jgi:hypothetical protein
MPQEVDMRPLHATITQEGLASLAENVSERLARALDALERTAA